MKISIGMKLQAGPWGGGNQFGVALKQDFERRGIEVVHHLNDADLDFILLCEPRKKLKISAFTDREIFEYLGRKNRRALVIHRINECDERKGTSGVNARLLRANLCADHTVFISDWLRQLFVSHGFEGKSSSVILNGSDRAIFHPEGHRPWDGREPMRLVTHHWSGHWMKGFDIYRRIDEMLGDPAMATRFSFTYIGNVPKDFTFRHSRYVEPTSGKALADLLREHHVYLTASRNEPCGHHQNEGANCGLPVLFLESGGIPENVRGFGLGFTVDNFEARLEEMRTKYAEIQPRLAGFDRTADRMSGEYHQLLMKLDEDRDRLIAARRPLRRLRWWWQGRGQGRGQDA